MAIACITGASSGIGMEFAKQLSFMGYNLILVARNRKALKELADSLPTKRMIITCTLQVKIHAVHLLTNSKNIISGFLLTMPDSEM